MAAQPAARHHPPRAAQLTPRSPAFVGRVLAPLASRAAAGEDPAVLARELYEGWVHHWALAEARRLAAGLPPRADRHELTSQVLRLAWESCARIDWARIASWPALLDRKVASARAEAARVDDWLSRRERTYRRRFQRAVAELEQTRGRAATAEERLALAAGSAPVSSRVDWAAELLAPRNPALVAEPPDLAGEDDPASDVEEALMRHERADCLHRWLAAVGAEDGRLAADLRRWCQVEADRSAALPGRLAHRVEPYAPLLAGLLVDA